jgi:primosomal protein N' (replication factor Y)
MALRFDGSPAPELTPAQSGALAKVAEVRAAVAEGRPPFGLLLEGVTGSGKTEVYLRAIAEEVAGGRQAIVLVPEIALTPQTISRFGGRFPRLAVLHSHLTEGQRADEWRRILSGGVDVVVGARSALFAPVPSLGVIVVDEEHEPSYKSPASPRYHARDVALERARIERALVILGSATPSLESWTAARDGRLAHAVLPERIGGRPLPPVEVVDMREERERSRGYVVLSAALENALRETVSRREQAFLFLNRRGYSTFLHCPRCGSDVRCETCDVPLAIHREAKGTKRRHNPQVPTGVNSGTLFDLGAMPSTPPASGALRCHYCGRERARPASCPSCGFGKLLALGTGTERVVEEAVRAAPGARVVRMDTDAMESREDYDRVLSMLSDGRADVLVGTQMIAKGLDLPRVTLVGVVNADVAMHLADFRASERAFQLIAQVAGRTGRSDLGGRVIVQTSLPESLAVRAGAMHDVGAFAREELEHRRTFSYPPFASLARVVVEGPEEEAVEKRIGAAAGALRAAAASDAPPGTAAVLGPAEAPLGRLRGRRRQHLIVKASDREALERVLWAAEKALRTSGKTRVTVDVDPVGMR